jgi:hypothetical protein
MGGLPRIACAALFHPILVQNGQNGQSFDISGHSTG